MTSRDAHVVRAPMTEVQDVGDWRGRKILAADGARLGTLEHVYTDVETRLTMFGSVRRGRIAKRLTFVPLPNATMNVPI